MAFLIGGANSAADTGYNVANSCRFEDGDSAYMHKTPTGAGNRRTFTLSWWFKRGNIGTMTWLYTPGSGDHATKAAFDSSNRLYIYDYSDAFELLLKTNRVFRDVSAYYHVVIAIDTTQGTAANRAKMYVNGVQESSFETATYPDQNYDLEWSGTNAHNIAKDNSGEYYDGYMAEFVYIDGLQLAPTSFGEFDEDSPTIWKPIDVSGLTFGTNGFYLDFEASGNLGNDANGGTDLTEVNLAATDQATDTPTNNFCTLNPLIFNAEAPTFSEGNCKFAATAGSNFEKTTGTIAVSTGKWYWEALMAATLTAHFVGVQTTNAAYDADEPMYVAGTTTFKNNDGGEIRTGGSETTADYGTFAADEVFGIALDMTAGSYGQFTIYKDNSAIASNINLSSTTGDGFIAPFVAGYNSTIEVNFGGCPAFAISSAAADANGYGTFEFAPPSGYLALCTKNLGSDGG